ncbi:MAG: HEPN domain-containing protein [Bryobacteraceae bacterium]|jgi:HEPN domain-containing protein
MAHDPVLVENTTAWLRKAGQDLRRVERCLADEPPDVEDALFHCQQAAEKTLKAFLTWHDQPFKKTHDLASLGSQCKGIDNSLDPLIYRLDDLSQYAWAFRYPTSLAEPPAPEVDEANALAHMILAEVVRRLPPGDWGL